MNPLINVFFTAPRSVMVEVMKKLNSQDLRIDLKILLDKNEDVEILKNEVLKLLRKYQNKINKDFINENKGKFLY